MMAGQMIGCWLGGFGHYGLWMLGVSIFFLTLGILDVGSFGKVISGQGWSGGE